MGGGEGASGSPSPRWRSGCLFKRSVGAEAGARRARFHGTGAAGAAGPRGSLGSSRSRRSKGAQLSSHGASGARPAAPPALPVAADALCGRAAAAPSSERRTSAPREPRTPTSAPRAQLLRRARTCQSEWRAARSPGGSRSRAAPLRRPGDCGSGAFAPGWPPAGRQAAPSNSGRSCK